jgi:sodium-dependent phosphate cotransporter
VRRHRLGRVVAVVSILVSVLVAVRLLGAATAAAAPALERTLPRVLHSDATALGAGWLAAYVLANGSVAAAVAVSLHASGLLPPSHLFALVAGSRLGAAAVVVLVGALNGVGRDEVGLREATGVGLLTFVVTHTVYLPATAVGLLALDSLVAATLGVGERLAAGTPPTADGALAEAVVGAVGAVPAVGLAAVLLVVALRLFDRLLRRLDPEAVRERVTGRLDRAPAAAVVGFVVTALTTSVAFSLGVVVPLYDRGYVRRDEVVPYALGANLGTVLDTLVVAALLGSGRGVAVILVLLSVSAAVTLLALLAHDAYAGGVSAVHDRLLTDRRAFLAFVALLVGAPTALLLVG